MPQIVLHGALAGFGPSYQMDVSSPLEAVRALCSQLPGFRKAMSSGNFHVIKKNVFRDKETYLEQQSLSVILCDRHEIHFVPVIEGSSKGGGSTKIMIGVAIIAAAFTFGAGGMLLAGADMEVAMTVMSAQAFSIAGFGVSMAQIAGFGAAMLLGGISQLLSATPKPTSSTSAYDSSYLFNGVANTSEQGVPVPLVYGRFMSGSVVISASITSENLMGGASVAANANAVAPTMAILGYQAALTTTSIQLGTETIYIQIASTANLANGSRISISGAAGTYGPLLTPQTLNGEYTVNVVDGTHLELRGTQVTPLQILSMSGGIVTVVGN